MRQILQNLKTGVTELADVPCPRVGHGQLLIRTSRSLISAGTERMLVDFGKANLVEKARQQPDKVRMVLDKLRTDGVMPTLNAIRNKLDQPLPLGYCNAGAVVELGAGVTGFAVGDRVAGNGQHAEMVSVPVNLCARIPDAVTDEQAAFTVAGAVALQGIRLAQPTLGEAVVVTGLGLIGQIVVQLLRANGCRVLGIDLDPARLELARSFGAETVNLAGGEDPVAVAQRFSRGHGVDAVIVTAATRSSEPMHQAALMCRKRGRIVLVGVTGLELSRDDFFKKELSFQVSCSYGPGRYDPAYEDKGQDYPVGYVRWTEQRNFEAVLDALAAGHLNVGPLVSHRFALDQAESAYRVVGGSEPSLGILLEYPASSGDGKDTAARRVILAPEGPPGEANDSPGIAFVGSGNYAAAILIPAFKAAGARLLTVASSAGVSAVHAGKKHGFRDASTDSAAILADPDISAVVISTRHDSHARLVVEALDAGKHVFVEKPLCLTLEELASIEAIHATSESGPADGRVQPPLRPSRPEDESAPGRSLRTESLRHDRERRRDPGRSLDSRSRRRRRPDCRGGLPLRGPAPVSRFVADCLPCSQRDGKRHGRHHHAPVALRGRFCRQCSLLCERLEGIPERTSRGLRRRAVFSSWITSGS